MMPIQIEAIASRAVNFSMQQNHIPILRKLTLTNAGAQDLENVRVELDADPPFLCAKAVTLSTLPPGQPILVADMEPLLRTEYLRALTEPVHASITLRALGQEQELGRAVLPIDVLTYDQWSGLGGQSELIAAFVTPNHPCIAAILARAGAILSIWCGSPAFTGYQSNNANTVRAQIAAIYAAIAELSIAYCVPPASFESGQRIRLCEQITEQKLGTCLDFSLLLASCLEAAGLGALIVFTRGHAFAACWLIDACFPEAVQDDVSMLTKRTAPGIHELCLIECTGLAAGAGVSFDAAELLAQKALAEPEEFDLAVDVRRARASGIRPLPHNVQAEDSSPDNQPTDAVSDAQAPAAIEVLDAAQDAPAALTRQQLWERKLLDLSLRNTLVNFRVTQSTLQLIAGQISDLEDALSTGQEFSVLPRPKEWEEPTHSENIFTLPPASKAADTLSREEFDNRRLRSFLDEAEAGARITRLYRQSRISLEENGTNTLYLALGFLRWYESPVSEKARYAPLVLLPVEIVRKSAAKGYVIREREEDAQVNITLLEMLRQDFGLTIAGLDPLPQDGQGVDIKKALHIIRQAVMHQPRWDVHEWAFIGLFSFSQFIMWNDLRNRSEEISAHPLVKSLLCGRLAWEPPRQFPEPAALDRDFAPSDMAVPLSADASQLSAICAAGQNHSFVLHGPPGTGKSQTIANMIANALFQGKSVLFVAEKIAALSVVQKRLESIGLGPFCLELHSNKARKKDVLSQLEQTLALGRIRPPEGYAEQARRLNSLRAELNGVVDAIHRPYPFGFSLYEAILRCERYKDAPDVIHFDHNQIKDLTAERPEDWEQALERLAIAAQQCGGAPEHPLRAFTTGQYTQALREGAQEQLRAYIQALSGLAQAFPAVQAACSLKGAATRELIAQTLRWTQLLATLSPLPTGLFSHKQLVLLGERVHALCEQGRRRKQLREQLLAGFDPGILTFDEPAAQRRYNEAQSGWFLPKYLGEHAVLRQMRRLCKNPRALTAEMLPQTLSLIREYTQCDAQIRLGDTLLTELFAPLWDGQDADWDALERMYEQAVEIGARLSVLCPDEESRTAAMERMSTAIVGDPADFLRRHAVAFAALKTHYEQAALAQDRLAELCGIDMSAIPEQDNWPGTMAAQARIWQEHLPALREWCAYVQVRNEAAVLGLSSVTRAYEDGILPLEVMDAAFHRALYTACADYILEQEKALAAFGGALFEGQIEKFRKVSQRFETLTRQELIARLSASLPTASVSAASSSEINILQRAIRSGGRMLSIRKLFDSIPNLLRLLAPCMLMSPISVAQYVDPRFAPFDLVIFDEASQLPTCEAVGAIARGRQVIVVGDPKQLPPTSFFSAGRIDEDNLDSEDLESILDDCLALSIPQQHLLWHYRSRHESLISFSNRQYYGNRLYTFPSPNEQLCGVSWVPVEGTYDRGKTRHNRIEALSVVDEIARRLRDAAQPRQSLGVVAFSSVQQHLIDDLLTERYAAEPELEELANTLPEPLFIKNLENVQGDERDVILFSIGYGADRTGKVSLNFGPLNQQGGWRRLNVAVSRAREEMMVFSSLRPEQIDLARTGAPGVIGLRAFLEFAKLGKSALPMQQEKAAVPVDEGLRLLAEQIRSLGYTLHMGVGCSEYKIDLAIVHPERPGEYVLGILCDGENYHAAHTARDRNLLQYTMLTRLGWNLHRLWIIDWWNHPARELERIKAAVERALTSAPPPPESPIEPPPLLRLEPEQSAKEPPEVYIPCELTSEKTGTEEFYLPDNDALLLTQLTTVLLREAPVSSNVLARRIQAAWNIPRMGAGIERRVEALLSLLPVQRTSSATAYFYWREDQSPAAYDHFRVPQDDSNRRSLEDVPPEEIACAAAHVLREQIGLSRSDLMREVSKLFGFLRASATMEAPIAEGIRYAAEHGLIGADGAGRFFRV